MKTITATLLLGLVFNFTSFSKPIATDANDSMLAINEVRYDAKLADDGARFTAAFDIESTGAGENAVKILEGDVAVLPAKLPDALKIVREQNRYFLVAPRAGRYR